MEVQFKKREGNTKRRGFTKKLNTFLTVTFAILLFPCRGQSAEEITGHMFSDYYYVLKHHSKNIEGRHGFWFRRIYLTYNNSLTENIKMRLRLEMKSAGDFKTKSKMTPVVKDAYLSYKTGGQEVMLGIISTPTWNIIEGFWEYRSLEKTPVDLQKFCSVRDFGISLKGSFDSEKEVTYMIMYGNGESISSGNI